MTATTVGRKDPCRVKDDNENGGDVHAVGGTRIICCAGYEVLHVLDLTPGTTPASPTSQTCHDTTHGTLIGVLNKSTH